MEPLVLNRLGKYVNLRELGRGGMGIVSLAEDTTLRREVALKVLHPVLTVDIAFVERFRKEAQSVSRILHPHIVRINSLEDLGNRTFAIDMEYVEGGSLHTWIACNVITPERGVRIAYHVLLGLNVCHDLGLIHRDLKPSNILMTSTGDAKVADFGLATAYAVHVEASTASNASTGTFVGTPRYAPPEAWEGADPTPCWDLYSLGLMMYEAFAGANPYDGANPLAIVRQLATKTVAPLIEVSPAVSPKLSEFVADLIVHDPTRRVATAEEALARLESLPEFEHAISGENTTLRMARPKRIHAARPPIRQHRIRKRPTRAVLALLASAAIACASIGWLLWASGNPMNHRETERLRQLVNTQQDLVRGGLPDMDDLLGASRLPATVEATFLTAQNLESAEFSPMEWVILAPTNGAQATLYAQWERGVAVMAIREPSSGTVALDGHWADFRDPAGRYLREGTVEGVGKWDADFTSLTASLVLRDARDNTSHRLTLTADRSTTPATDTEFVFAMESSEWTQHLIFDALMPREIAWADDVAGLFPAVIHSRLTAPLLSDGEPVTVDGILGEGLWNRRYFDESGPIGELTGRPEAAGATLLGRGTDDALALGITIPAERLDDWLLVLSIVPRIPAPLSASDRYVLAVASSGERETHHYLGAREVPWVCDWRDAIHTGNGALTGEFLMPAAQLDEFSRIAPDNHWRLNLALFSGHAPNVASLRYQWGFPDPQQPQFGVLISFREPQGSS